MGVVECHCMCWPVCISVILTVPSPVNPLCLQSLFHVTDVFLPPDYVANLQKVTDPTLTCAVAPALSMLTHSCHHFLLPFPPVNAPYPNIPCLWLPSEAVCLPTTLHTLQWSIQRHSWGAEQEGWEEAQVCQGGIGPTPTQLTR